MYGRPMTEGAPWKHIARFAFPILCGLLLQQLYNTADMVVVGNFSGQNELAAIGTTGTMVFMFLAIAIGFSAGNGVVVAQHFGAKRDKEVRASAATGIVLLLAMGGVATVIGIALSRFAYIHLVSVPENILDSTLVYFRIYCAGLIFQFGYNILAAILRAVGDSAATLYFLLIAAALNILLDLLFVGVFRWGSAGAAVATDIAQAGSMLAAWVYMARKYPVFRFKSRDLAWNNALVGETLRVGSPIALQLVIVSLGLTLIQRAVNSFGEVMTAAFSVGHRVELYMHLPCNAIQTTLATYTGQNIGAGRMDRVKLGAWHGLTISILLTAVVSVPVWILADRIVMLFALKGMATEYCAAYLRALALVNVILAAYVPLFGVFQGNRHTGIPTMVAICALTTRVIVTYLWKDSAFFGPSIIWWNGAFGFCAGCLVSWIYFLSGRWKRRPETTH